METSTDVLLREALPHAMSYQEYKVLMQELVDDGSTTGPSKTESLVNYTQLNHSRMKRWDKVVKLDTEAEELIKNSTFKGTWLVLTESWCGDAAPALPIMQKVAALNPNISLKIILRDEHVPLMNRFLTNGGMSIPKLIAISDKDNDVVGDWGPRSQHATALVENHKETNNGTILPAFKEELQRWYNKDKGQSILEDLLKLLALK